jgi:hypothetical protein
LNDEASEAYADGDTRRQIQAHELIATMQGRYNIHGRGNLRDLNRDYNMIRFEAWLEHQWQNEDVDDD